MDVNIILTPNGARINKTNFTEAPTLSEILSKFGEVIFPREKELHDAGKLWRKFIVLDQLGIYLLYDLEIERVLDIHFCFSRTKAAQSPKEIFSGLLFVNGVRLVAGMPERLLPVNGEFSFLKYAGWQATSQSLFVHLRLKGRNKQLEAASISFLKRSKFTHQVP